MAKSLAAQQPITLHFASSMDIPRLMPTNSTRMEAPSDLCQGPGITWALRAGRISYGGVCLLEPLAASLLLPERQRFQTVYLPNASSEDQRLTVSSTTYRTSVVFGNTNVALRCSVATARHLLYNGAAIPAAVLATSSADLQQLLP